MIAQEGWTQEDWYEWAENSGIPGVLATPLGVLVRDNSGFNASIYMHGGDTSSPAGFYGYLSISLGWIAAQMEGRASPTDAGPLGTSSAVVSLAMSSTGTSILRLSAFRSPVSMIVIGR